MTPHKARGFSAAWPLVPLQLSAMQVSTGFLRSPLEGRGGCANNMVGACQRRVQPVESMNE